VISVVQLDLGRVRAAAGGYAESELDKSAGWIDHSEDEASVGPQRPHDGRQREVRPSDCNPRMKLFLNPRIPFLEVGGR